MDMKYKIYCISAMMLCCMASKAQEDSVAVGDSTQQGKTVRVQKHVKTRTIRGKVLRSHGQDAWHQRLQYVDGRRRDF